jgi:aconitate hydratase
VNGKDYDRIEQGDRLSVDTTLLKEGMQLIVKNETKNIEFPVASPLCQADLDSVKAGGVINQVKSRSRIKLNIIISPPFGDILPITKGEIPI